MVESIRHRDKEAVRQVGQQTEKAQMQISSGFSISVSVLDVSAFEVMFFPSAFLGPGDSKNNSLHLKAQKMTTSPFLEFRLGPHEHKLQPVICKLKGTKRRQTQKSYF